MRGRLATAVLALIALLVVPGPGRARVPRDFYGVASQGPLTATDFDAMRRGNVGTLRFGIPWKQVEPSPGSYEWSYVDAIVAGAAGAGVDLLPVTYGSPAWLSAREAKPPIETTRQREAWTAFHRELARRYGREGTFWTGRAEYAPIRRWQPWNEPNLRYFWGGKPKPKAYARLLKLASNAIRAEDPRARVVLAGLAPGRGKLPWDYLGALYRVRGIERHIDTVAFHPYAGRIREVRYLLDRMRSAIRRVGSAKTPLEITELSWGSGGPRGYPLVRTPQGQARMLRKGFRLLRQERKRWRISGVQWFSWEDGARADAACLWCEHAGLFTLDRQPKPAWRAFKRFTTK